MPLVTIDAHRSVGRERLRLLAGGVHEAMVEAIGIPEHDRFQVLRLHDEDLIVVDPEFLEVERSEATAIVQITLRSGRPVERKQALYAAIATRAESAGLRRQDVTVVLRENDLADWSFGDGRAQYVEDGLPA